MLLCQPDLLPLPSPSLCFSFLSLPLQFVTNGPAPGPLHLLFSVSGKVGPLHLKPYGWSLLSSEMMKMVH